MILQEVGWNVQHMRQSNTSCNPKEAHAEACKWNVSESEGDVRNRHTRDTLDIP